MERLGRYEVRGELGRGAMGRVLRGWDPGLRREVALKQVLFERHTPEDVRTRLLGRFAREARALALMRHPAIVGVYELGEDLAGPFLAMELIEGESLGARLARAGPLPLPELLSLGATLAGALQHAHDQGVLHRDVKPGNVVLAADGPRLIDFGLAKMAEMVAATDDVQTAPGRLVGTPHYMSPEQFQCDPQLGPPCDVWGLGATLYEAATGTLAFPGTSLPTLMRQVLRGELPRTLPSRARAELPVELDALILSCLGRLPPLRPTAGAVGERLAELSRASGGRPAPCPRPAPAGPSPVEVLGQVMAASLSSESGSWSDARGPEAEARRPDVDEIAARAQALFAQGEVPAAVASFTAGLALDPTRPELWAMRGVARRRCGNLAGAAADFEAALQLQPDELRALVGRGLVCLERGDVDGAERDLRRALGLLPPGHPRRVDVLQALQQARAGGAPPAV